MDEREKRDARGRSQAADVRKRRPEGNVQKPTKRSGQNGARPTGGSRDRTEDL